MVGGLQMQGANFDGTRFGELTQGGSISRTVPPMALAWLPKDRPYPYGNAYMTVSIYTTGGRNKVLTDVQMPVGSNDEIAQSTNSYGVRNLVQAADRAGAQMVQISTDYVFDGTLGRPYIESDTTNPLSVYGKTKLEGEKAVREGDLLVRTSWLCGTHGSNILKTIIALAQQDKALTFVNDQIGHPSFTSDIALVISNLIDVEAKGTFHVTNQGAVSWFEFAQTVLNSMGRSPAQVSPTTTAELRPPRAAVRPANAALQNDALQWAGLPLAPHFQETLPRLVKDLCG